MTGNHFCPCCGWQLTDVVAQSGQDSLEGAAVWCNHCGHAGMWVKGSLVDFTPEMLEHPDNQETLAMVRRIREQWFHDAGMFG